MSRLSACFTCGELVFADEEQFMQIHGLLFHASCARYQRRVAA